MSVEKKRKFIINTLFITIICVIAFFIIKYALTSLLPFVIGLLCAVILQKPVNWLTEKTKLPRAMWSIIMVVLLLSGLMGGIGLLGYRMYEELQQLIVKLSDTLPALSVTIASASKFVSRILDRLPDAFVSSIQGAASSIAESLLGYLSDIVTAFAKIAIGNLPTILIGFVISIIACCFITNDYNKITAFVLRQFSEEHQAVIKKSKSLFMENIVKVLRGYILIMIITYFELLLGLTLIGIPYSGIIALLIAVFDILPILGVGGVLIPWGIISIILGDTLLGIEILVLYAVITVIRNVIEPKIIGKQVGLPAFVTLLSMYVGLKLFGIIGLWCMPILLIIIVKLQEAGMIRIWKMGKKVENQPVLNEEKQ
ncbi:MAG: sporulation integral membrane protein YtvI [Clostridia bacterium]|nr:sporulation integral membrane protein YtvI [Clostridia bacterium]